MTILYKLINGTPKPPPSSITLEDGRFISNFPSIAHEYGYKPLIVLEQPIYDTKHEYLSSVYEENETEIIESFKIMPKYSLDVYKKSKITEFNKFCNETILAGFISLGYQFIFDMEAQVNFTQQKLDIMDDPTILTVDWKTEDQGVKTFTVDEFRQIITDAKVHKMTNIQRYWEIKDQILAATSFEEIDTIVW